MKTFWHAEKTWIHQLGSDLLANLAHHGIHGELAEFDSAAQRPIERLLLDMIAPLKDQQPIAIANDSDRDRSDAFVRHKLLSLARRAAQFEPLC